jgi:hypothetical protein
MMVITRAGVFLFVIGSLWTGTSAQAQAPVVQHVRYNAETVPEVKDLVVMLGLHAHADQVLVDAQNGWFRFATYHALDLQELQALVGKSGMVVLEVTDGPTRGNGNVNPGSMPQRPVAP